MSLQKKINAVHSADDRHSAAGGMQHGLLEFEKATDGRY